MGRKKNTVCMEGDPANGVVVQVGGGRVKTLPYIYWDQRAYLVRMEAAALSASEAATMRPILVSEVEMRLG